jgi:hypothetical protein
MLQNLEEAGMAFFVASPSRLSLCLSRPVSRTGLHCARIAHTGSDIMSEPRQEVAPQDQLSTIMKMVMELSQEVQTLKKPMDVDNTEVSTSETTEAEPGVSWSDVLRPQKTEAQSEKARRLCRLFTTAPALQHLQASEGEIPSYSGVPETPTARWNDLADSQLQVVQRKLELSLNLLVLHSDSDHPTALLGAAAWTRSAWQDLHEQRRRLLAGAESHKLQARKDDIKANLLTDEEKRKLSKQDRVSSASTWRGRSPDWGTGQGKGSGGERSRDPSVDIAPQE